MKRMIALALLAFAGCGDSGSEPDPPPEPTPTAASVQVDAVSRTFDGVDSDRYALTLSNHGSRPGTFKIEAWGLPLNQPNAGPQMWGETDPVSVSGSYEEQLEITVPDRTRALIVLTRQEDSAVYARTDSVDLTELW